MNEKISVVGSGKMASAIINGIRRDYETEVIAREGKRADSLKKMFKDEISVRKLARNFDIEGKNLIICVKPGAFDDLCSHFTGKANSVISVMAGIPLEKLRYGIDSLHTIRAMPNLAATYGKSMTTLCGDDSFKNEAVKICSTFGRTLWLEREKEIDIATALAGSGPAFLAIVAEALNDAAVAEGLKREDATALTEGLFDGFASLVRESHPAILKDSVMSPGGTTAAGVCALEERSARDAFMKAIRAASEKARKLKG